MNKCTVLGTAVFIHLAVRVARLPRGLDLFFNNLEMMRYRDRYSLKFKV